MLEAGLAWLALIGFELIQGLRHKPTLSQFAWSAGRSRKWLKWLGVGLVALLAIHLLLPMWKADPPPVPDAPDYIDVEE